MEKKPIQERLAELRSESDTRMDLHQVYGTMVNEGYQPEEIIMWTAADQSLS